MIELQEVDAVPYDDPSIGIVNNPLLKTLIFNIFHNLRPETLEEPLKND